MGHQLKGIQYMMTMMLMTTMESKTSQLMHIWQYVIFVNKFVNYFMGTLFYKIPNCEFTKYAFVNSQICEREEIWECSSM
jgi:hypothetical protein